ncbi:MAG: sulfatase-like hydrolase/transferase [Bryobacterales bacterium]|nr:sulfatase-like hydrolase/transferase [Bryobacterales bacterium]
MPNSISRRDFVQTLAAAPALAASAEGYNILFLMSDEHSPHAAGWLGNKIVRTPAIDSLARAGAAFSASYCQNPVCVPSRASFLTSRMASNVGVFGNDGGLVNDVPKMGSVFRGAGYQVSWMGKTHWGGESGFDVRHGSDDAADRPDRRKQWTRQPEDAGVADWPVSQEPDTIAKNHALRFLEENRGKRFFAGVSFRKPHFPFAVQEEFYKLYNGRLDAPRVTPRMIEELPLVSKKERETYGFAKLNQAQIVKAREVYFGMVTYMDSLVGEILKKLDDLGLREKTIILYTSDHGEMAGEHGLWYKNSFYEASARIPMVWSFPREIPRGKQIHAPVMNMDIFPTLCELTGVPLPGGLEGRSLLPLIKGAEDGGKRYALAESFRGGYASRMIRSGQWKYCYYHEDSEQLFDLRNNPEENVNLVKRPEHRDLVAALNKRALEGWRLQQYRERKKARKKGA